MGNEFNIFWKKKIKLISWFKKPKKILTKKNGKYVWFNDGKSNVARTEDGEILHFLS